MRRSGTTSELLTLHRRYERGWRCSVADASVPLRQPYQPSLSYPFFSPLSNSLKERENDNLDLVSKYLVVTIDALNGLNHLLSSWVVLPPTPQHSSQLPNRQNANLHKPRGLGGAAGTTGSKGASEAFSNIFCRCSSGDSRSKAATLSSH